MRKKQRDSLLKKNLRIVVIDNYDSFTYNLVHYLGSFTQNIFVFKNDAVSIGQIKQLQPTHIVLSPGPGNPKTAGISKKVIVHFYDKAAILGVCLGHQCIAEVFGAKIVHAPTLFHGKTSMIAHNNHGIFKNVKNPFTATRYHSLLVSSHDFPAVLAITATTETVGVKTVDTTAAKKLIMGVQHRKYPVYGVQFHPESILTTEGKKLISKFLQFS